MSVYDSPTPMTMAARLAEYIADPSTIRVRVLEYYGRAPTIEQCRHLRQAVIDRRRTEEHQLRRRSHSYKIPEVMACGHPSHDDNIDWHGDKMICVICEEQRAEKARRRWAVRAKVRASAISDEHRERPRFDVILSPSQRVLKAACHVFNVPLEAIRGRGGDRLIASTRFAIALVLHEADPIKYSSSVIAAVVNRKDHTTILHAIKRAREIMAGDEVFAKRIEALREAYATGPEKVPEDVVEALVRRAA